MFRKSRLSLAATALGAIAMLFVTAGDAQARRGFYRGGGVYYSPYGGGYGYGRGVYRSGYRGGYGPYGWGWGGGWGGGTTTTQVRDILVGTLVIDVADAKKGQLAWRGMGVKEVNTQANPEKRDKSINNAVKKIFKNYPPKKKS